MKGTAIPKKNAPTIYPVSRRLDLKRVQVDHSNIGLVTNDVLRTHSSDTNKLICFGVSEGTLNDIAQGIQPWNVFDEDFWISAGLRMHVRSKLFKIKIDFVNHVVVFFIKTCLEFYASDQTPNVEDDKLAFVAINFNFSAIPSLNIITSDDQQLQLKFSDASFTIDNTNIIDLSGLARAGFGTPTEFNEFINQIVSKMCLGRSGPYGTVLPPIAEGFPLPDQWNQHEGYRLDFEGFDYRSVTVGDVEVGYLFLIFNIESLMYSPLCVCKEDEILDLEQTLEPEPLLWSSVGFSRQALVEIARPLIDISNGHKDEKRWRPLYAKLSSHYTIHLAGAGIDIHADSVFSEAAGEAGGSVSAGIKEWTGQLNISAGLTIDLRSVQVTWSPVVLRDKINPSKMVIYLNPSLPNMATPIIELKTDLPGWADKVTSWILSNTVGQGLKYSITRAVAIGSMLGMFYFMVEDPNPEEGDIWYTYDHYEFFERESVVIIGELFYHYVG